MALAGAAERKSHPLDPATSTGVQLDTSQRSNALCLFWQGVQMSTVLTVLASRLMCLWLQTLWLQTLSLAETGLPQEPCLPAGQT